MNFISRSTAKYLIPVLIIMFLISVYIEKTSGDIAVFIISGLLIITILLFTFRGSQKK